MPRQDFDALTPEQKAKFKRVMAEYGRGTLKSSNGDKVATVEQATAIAFSEARKVGKENREAD